MGLGISGPECKIWINKAIYLSRRNICHWRMCLWFSEKTFWYPHPPVRPKVFNSTVFDTSSYRNLLRLPFHFLRSHLNCCHICFFIPIFIRVLCFIFFLFVYIYVYTITTRSEVFTFTAVDTSSNIPYPPLSQRLVLLVSYCAITTFWIPLGMYLSLPKQLH